jgi:hypothetical protein
VICEIVMAKQALIFNMIVFIFYLYIVGKLFNLFCSINLMKILLTWIVLVGILQNWQRSSKEGSN